MIPRNARQNIGSSAYFNVRKHRPDYGLLIIASILLVIGLVVMYSISPALAAQGGNVGENYFVTRQFIAIILGVVAFMAASKISINTWEKWQKPIIIGSLGLCLLTIVLGGIGNRWVQLGTFSFQPVELVKFTLVVCGSAILANIVGRGAITKLAALKPLLIIFTIFGVVIVVLQRDLGSAFVLMAIAAIMAFLAGIPMKRLAFFGALGAIAVVLAISSTAYRRDRLLTYVQPERDCIDNGYHACQALIAVGSGGVFGLGLGRSVQAYGYLPEAANDSIFAIYAEKFGFAGAVVLIALIGSLLLRILNIMQRAPNKTTQLITGGVFAWLGIQTMVNIGAMVGLLPLKGITLPFISYGGTSLIFAMAALGVVFQISSYTSMRKSEISYDNERDSSENNHSWRRDSRPRYAITRRSI